MSFFVTILLTIAGGNLVWWRIARARLVAVGAKRIGHRLLAGWMFLQAVMLLGIIGARLNGGRMIVPQTFIAAAFLWHLLVMPATLLALGTIAIARRAGRRFAGRVVIPPHGPPAPPVSLGPSRRELLAAAAIAAPPLLCGGITGYAIRQLPVFRVRDLIVPIPNLPIDLDGLTIAHISDTHVGRFTTPETLRNLADAINSLGAELVCFTGDLIDYSLLDLPTGLEFLHRIDRRGGMVVIEGNHDLFEDRWKFEKGVRSAGFKLLLNSTADLMLHGVPIQLLGTRWGTDAGRGPAMYAENCAATLAFRRRDAFPILLSHHPHGFDPAAAAGIPLTLAGHTHGGQLNLTTSVGFGRVYKYWSGLYRQGDSRAVVSNGCGNWFPLRVNAPAEIGLLTLRREG